MLVHIVKHYGNEVASAAFDISGVHILLGTFLQYDCQEEDFGYSVLERGEILGIPSLS